MKTRSVISILLCGAVSCALLIGYVITAPLLSVGVPIRLPKADAKALPLQAEPITIFIDKDGRVLLEGAEITLDDLGPRLMELLPNGYDERIYLNAGEYSEYSDVIKVMARVNAAGFSNLGLVTDPVNGK